MRLFCLLPLLATACVSGAKIRAEADVLRADLERARRSGAMRCAPVQLATAEASIDFAMGELSQGNSVRANDHVRDADVAVKKALSLSRDCGPKQVLVKDGPDNKKLVFKIEETDSDGDGVSDKEDKCPDAPEDRDAFQDDDGCPEPDNDNDGVLDGNDKCPVIPGPLSNQGCPESDSDSDGLVDDKDKCPKEAGPIENFGCPVLDKDKDGLNDDKDKCPDEPEDKDGFQDEDGCPDPDNDGDGVPDTKDKCPNEYGSPDEQGCPKQYKMVVVKKDRIEIKQQIKFSTGSAKIIGKDSIAILDDIARALTDNPQIKKIRIEGHTDSVGNDATNLKLSQNRANSVMSQLIKRRVDPARMEAVGFGETMAIGSNSTSAGRAENRRTEFNIVDQ
ncbi:MAG: OmpA family protein [Myxococcaceae bacterium]